MNDDGKPENDMTQHDAQAYELIEQLNLLEAVDQRITPEHVAKRFRELLDDIGDDGLPGAAADGHPREVPDQMGCGGQITRLWEEDAAELVGLNSSLEAAIADAQSKAKAAADELRRAQEATTAARQQAERIVAEARAQGDKALEQAAKMVRDARDQARQIRGEAEDEADQIVSAAGERADEALKRAARMVRDARDQARQIRGEAEDEADQTVSAAGERADEALKRAARMVRDARQQSEQIISEAHREAEQITCQSSSVESQIRAFPLTADVAAAAGALASFSAASHANLVGVPNWSRDVNDFSSAPAAAGSQGSDSNPVEIATQIASTGDAAALGGTSALTPEIVRSVVAAVTAVTLTERTVADDRTEAARLSLASAPALSTSGQICAVVAVDIVGFTRPDRDDDIRRYLHERLYEYLQQAFDRSGVPWAECFCEDRGDGALIVIPPEIPVKGLIDSLPYKLHSLIRRHNHVVTEAAGMQLRVAAHIGPVEHDGHGFVGTDINFAFRMLDARPLRSQLAKSGAEIGLIVSDHVYDSLIRRYPGLADPGAFRTVRFQTKNTRARAWMHLPGLRPISTAPDADAAAELRPGSPEASSGLKSLTSPGTPEPQIPKIETTEDTMTSMPAQLVCNLRR